MSWSNPPGHDHVLVERRLHLGIVFRVFVGQEDTGAHDAQRVFQQSPHISVVVSPGGRKRQQRLAVVREQRLDQLPQGDVLDPLLGDPQQFVDTSAADRNATGADKASDRTRRPRRRRPPRESCGFPTAARSWSLDRRRGLCKTPRDSSGRGSPRPRANRPRSESLPRGRRRESPRDSRASSVLVFSSSLTVISRNRSASWPGEISESVRMGMAQKHEKGISGI